MDKGHMAKTNASRKIWILSSHMCTFFLPNYLLKNFFSSPESLCAWREKIALCTIVATLSGLLIFYISTLPSLLCPPLKMMSLAEFNSLNHRVFPYTIVHGKIYDLSKIVSAKAPTRTQALLTFYVGKDASELFPRRLAPRNHHIEAMNIDGPPTVISSEEPPSYIYLPGEDQGDNPAHTQDVQYEDQEDLPYEAQEDLSDENEENLSHENKDIPAGDGAHLRMTDGDESATTPTTTSPRFDHDVRLFDGIDDDVVLSRKTFDDDSLDATFLLTTLAQHWVADLAFDRDSLVEYGSTLSSPLVAINRRIYNMSSIVGKKNYKETSFPFKSVNIKKLTCLPPWGIDKTSLLMEQNLPLSEDDLFVLEQLFFAGVMDGRSAVRCAIADWLIILSSLLVVSVMAVKFLAALQLGRKRSPERLDRNVILQVSCFTEGEESLKRTIDSLAALSYEDSCKLLFIVCDGVVVGAGNDRPTPRIVLDILGVDPSVDPPALPYDSIGEDTMNYAKVYSGTYTARKEKGPVDPASSSSVFVDMNVHIVPFLVIVKVGVGNEQVNVGNRGKRDSQLILLRWLSNIIIGRKRIEDMASSSPLDSALTTALTCNLGIDPLLYDFCLMVDADTQPDPDALTRLMSVMVSDTKVIGVCGETCLANEKATWVTAIQVYEYYISHHFAKAFESLFGTVTCLPGCFSLYRIKGGGRTRTPLLVSPPLLADYSKTSVDTLHQKNLLSLGEDRYLTTLLLKHHPRMKTAFAGDAKCRTQAPDTWSVFLSQRRRWINSTVHNLFELLFLPQLCGFGCFSMRMVVFLDLFATLVMPATIAYLLYLGVKGVFGHAFFPGSTLLMLGSSFAMQALVFLLKRQWKYVRWMVLYLLALPLFGLVMPLYAFWNFDDFSWGMTRREHGAYQSCGALVSRSDVTLNASSLPTGGGGRSTLFGPKEAATRSVFVSDDDIKEGIIKVLRDKKSIDGCVDVMSVKDIRLMVEKMLDVDLSDRKEWLATTIEDILVAEQL